MRTTTLNIRTTNQTKHLLQQAANMLGTTVSGFLLNSAMEKAYEVIQSQNHFLLDDKQLKKFCSVLDRPPVKNKKLIAILKSEGVFKDE